MTTGCAATREGGFTLLEIVIALAIVATLIVYAVPSYQGYVARGRRIEATAALYRAAQYVEANAAAGVAVLPSGLDQSPQQGAAVYRLRIVPADDGNGGYVVEAAPVDTGPMRDDPCGTFSLDALGTRLNRSASPAGVPPAADCWYGR
jgi:type IV pilus assembly protein PilE